MSSQVFGQTNNKATSFTYSGLYNSLKTSKESSFAQLSLDFLLLDNKTNQRCDTQYIVLDNGNSSHEILMDNAGALMLPLDKQLKTDRALIHFKTTSDRTCNLSMQISVADFELDKITKAAMLSWLSKFEGIYATLAGWPAKYFMPNVNGLAIYTIKQRGLANVLVNHNKQQVLSINNGVLFLTKKQIEKLPKNSQLVFDLQLKKILPMLSK